MSPRWLQNFFSGKQEQASASPPAHLRLGRKGEDAARAEAELDAMYLRERGKLPEKLKKAA